MTGRVCELGIDRWMDIPCQDMMDVLFMCGCVGVWVVRSGRLV